MLAPVMGTGSGAAPPTFLVTLARLRLARTDGIGPLTFRRLLARHGSAEAALDALPTLTTRYEPRRTNKT